jgi:hypothetical protein
MIAAIYVQRSICSCGISVLYDSVPLGRSYQVDGVASSRTHCPLFRFWESYQLSALKNIRALRPRFRPAFAPVHRDAGLVPQQP